MSQQRLAEDKKASGWTAIDEVERVEPPEAYVLLLTLRGEGFKQYWSGGWADQPFLLYQEFDACVRAEEEYKDLQLVNAMLASANVKAKAEGNKIQ